MYPGVGSLAGANRWSITKAAALSISVLSSAWLAPSFGALILGSLFFLPFSFPIVANSGVFPGYFLE
jgi:hypothetical protein